MCFRLLAELMIEKPPISSTSTSTLAFVCGGPLSSLRVSSSSSPSESVEAALARFRGPPAVLGDGA